MGSIWLCAPHVYHGVGILNVAPFQLMKKSYLAILCFFLCLPLVDAAHYYNKDLVNTDFVTMNHFVLEKVKADRAMRDNVLDPEQEDHWKIYYHFTVDVTNFELHWEALDGTNDHDTREYTDKRDDRDANDVHDLSHDNFPTYVDNMKIDVKYVYNGEAYSFTFYIYTIGDADEGSGDLGINTSSIPEEYQDKDGNGWDPSDVPGSNTLEQIYKFVKLPYDFAMWLVDINNIISLGVAFGIIYATFLVSNAIPNHPFKFIFMLIMFFISGTMIVGSLQKLLDSIL